MAFLRIFDFPRSNRKAGRRCGRSDGDLRIPALGLQNETLKILTRGKN
jgi:hypothetical protein